MCAYVCVVHSSVPDNNFNCTFPSNWSAATKLETLYVKCIIYVIIIIISVVLYVLPY